MKKILVLLCVVLFNVMKIQAQQIELVNVQAAAAVSQPLLESQVFHLINQHRVANSLPPLRWASTPAHLSRRHSLNMANGVVPFGHDGFGERYNKLKRKIPSLTSMAENVAYNFGYPNPAEVAVNNWLASPGHYANIMGDYNLAGVGVAKNERGEYYFTQIFAKANVSQLNALEINDDQFEKEAVSVVE